ncbi:MAG: hypothetical protein R2719_03585 [Micropruina sp.]
MDDLQADFYEIVDRTLGAAGLLVRTEQLEPSRSRVPAQPRLLAGGVLVGAGPGKRTRTWRASAGGT